MSHVQKAVYDINFFLVDILNFCLNLRKCCSKKVFLEISQNLQENIRAKVSFLIKLQALKTWANLLSFTVITNARDNSKLKNKVVSFSCKYCSILSTEHCQEIFLKDFAIISPESTLIS